MSKGMTAQQRRENKSEASMLNRIKEGIALEIEQCRARIEAEEAAIKALRDRMRETDRAIRSNRAAPVVARLPPELAKRLLDWPGSSVDQAMGDPVNHALARRKLIERRQSHGFRRTRYYSLTDLGADVRGCLQDAHRLDEGGSDGE